MEFYERLEQAKKTLKLTNEDLGNVIGKKPDAFRLATVKRSLKNYDIKDLTEYLDNLEGKEIKNPQQNDGSLKDKMIELLEHQLRRAENALDRANEEIARIKNK